MRGSMNAAVLLIIIIIIAATLPTLGQQSKFSFQDAAQALATGNLQKAENELQTILRDSPDDYRALDLLGIVRAQQHKNVEAEELFKRVIGLKPDFASAHIHLGLLHEQMGHQEDSIGELQEGLRLDPTRTDAATNLVSICRSQARRALSDSDLEKALSLLIKARRVAPDDPDVQFEFGMVALRMSLLPDAVEAFQKTLKIREKDEKAVYGLADDAAGHYALGLSLVALQNPQDARNEFEKSIALAPVQTESYFRLGLLDLDSKDFNSAERNLRHALDRDPKHAGALAALGRLRFEQKAYAEAVDYLQRAIASDDRLREAHYYLGLTYARLGHTQEANEQLQIATRLEHEDTEKQRTMLRILDPGHGRDSAQK
ncbi:MAG: hypothetical protein DMG78_09755 [Acidobacteria bacterium]|nr:MAG: hypothetical protein DMG78_09755 [Acidobacteriota bacterium]